MCEKLSCDSRNIASHLKGKGAASCGDLSPFEHPNADFQIALRMVLVLDAETLLPYVLNIIGNGLNRSIENLMRFVLQVIEEFCIRRSPVGALRPQPH